MAIIRKTKERRVKYVILSIDKHSAFIHASGTKQSYIIRDRHVVSLLAMTHECNDNLNLAPCNKKDDF